MDDNYNPLFGDLAELDRAIRFARYQSRLRARLEELARLAREERRLERESAAVIRFSSSRR
jgi:hypothetical protein